MNAMPVTSILTGYAVVLLVALSLPISLYRMKARIKAGDGGDEALRRLVRAQGNYIEYAPLGLLAVALAELGGWPPAWLWGAGGAFMAARTVQAIGIRTDQLNLRKAGTVVTHLSLLVLGALLLTGGFLALQPG